MLNAPSLAALLGGPLVAASPDHALAYIGPGAGLGAIAVMIALILGVLLLAVGLVWYPLKRRFKARTGAVASGGRTDEPE